VLFGKFIRKEIFPGGMLVVPEQIVRHAENAGFKVERLHSLREDYARTLDIWAANPSRPITGRPSSSPPNSFTIGSCTT